MRSSLIRTLTLGLAALTLAACSSTSPITAQFDSRQNAGPCPPMGAIYDVSRYVAFTDGATEIYPNITFSGEIVDVRMDCRYVGDDPLVAEMEIDFAFGKGDAAGNNTHTYPFFVAVTRRNGKVLSKEIFNTKADFGSGRVTGNTEQVARVTIPRVDETISGSNFEILVGFDLTEEQLAFNRAGSRFRLDAQN